MKLQTAASSVPLLNSVQFAAGEDIPQIFSLFVFLNLSSIMLF